MLSQFLHYSVFRYLGAVCSCISAAAAAQLVLTNTGAVGTSPAGPVCGNSATGQETWALQLSCDLPRGLFLYNSLIFGLGDVI